MIAMRQLYQCSVCDDYFEIQDLGHCPRCAHHYRAGTECGNCHMHTVKKTMKRLTPSENARAWKYILSPKSDINP